MKEKREKEHDLTHLYAALGAVAFFVAGVPVLDAVGGWISNVFGLKSVKLNAEATKYAKELESNEDCGGAHAIGFTIPSDEDEVECDG